MKEKIYFDWAMILLGYCLGLLTYALIVHIIPYVRDWNFERKDLKRRIFENSNKKKRRRSSKIPRSATFYNKQ